MLFRKVLYKLGGMLRLLLVVSSSHLRPQQAALMFPRRCSQPPRSDKTIAATTTSGSAPTITPTGKATTDVVAETSVVAEKDAAVERVVVAMAATTGTIVGKVPEALVHLSPYIPSLKID